MSAIIKRDFDDLSIRDMGDIFVKSGYFKDARDQAQAIVKILYGRELGFSPVISMSGIHIIEGKPALSANLLGAMVKRSGKYDYRIVTLTDTACSLEFTQDGKVSGTSDFTMNDANRAGVVRQGSGWTKYPRNMLFARALSNGAKMFCPELSACPVYVPEELGADVNAEGEVTTLPKSARPVEVIEREIVIEAPKVTEEEAREAVPPIPPPVSGFISVPEARDLHIAFRNALPEDTQHLSKELLRDWCHAKGYRTDADTGSTKRIPSNKLKAVTIEAIEYAASLNTK